MHIVTVVTESQYYFPYLMDSCKKNGQELTILGYGEKWLGFNWRLTKMINFLKQLPEHDIVCVVDGYDVICTRHLNELEDEFIKIKNRTNCKLIVSKEILYGFNSVIGYFFFGKCKQENLNAGTYIATAGDMLNIITKVYNLNPKDNADDQVLLTKYCNSSEDIYIDTHNEIFLSISHSLTDLYQYVEHKNGLFYYNNNAPFFVHAPGSGILDTMVEKLGYGKCKIKKQLKLNIFNKKTLHFMFHPITLGYFVSFCFVLFLLFNFRRFLRTR